MGSVLKGEVFISLRTDGIQIFHAADHRFKYGHHTELFLGDALPCSQGEEGVAALYVGGWDDADITSCFFSVYII